MEERLYVQILSELKRAGTVRSFLPMLQNEPLVDREIAKRVRQAKEILGGTALVHMVTNGSLLTSKRADNLLEAGTDSFSVSIDAFREETYRSIRKGLSFSRVIGNVQSLLQRDPRPLVFARFLKQRANAGEEKMFTRYWKARGARPFVHSVVNRAGTLDSFDRVEEREARLMRRLVRRVLSSIFPLCPHPFLSLNVLWDGRVILCCHDWGPGVIVGDLTKQSLTTVWNGEAMNHYRHLLYRDRSEESPSCANCSCRNGLWGPKSRKALSQAYASR
ncbi:MAG: SPASM domain-containing protein, partial [Deltaproteobacteria bacterium]|nr:SPASM domain-containing protein [Deltaproteobacteria bacterium]